MLEGLRKRGVLLNGDAREASAQGRQGPDRRPLRYRRAGRAALPEGPPTAQALLAAQARRQGRPRLQARRHPPRPLPPARGAGGRGGDRREGEKDADRLRSLGFVATTNLEGASGTEEAKWRAEYAEPRSPASASSSSRQRRRRAGRTCEQVAAPASPARPPASRCSGSRACGPRATSPTGSTPGTPPTSCAS